MTPFSAQTTSSRPAAPDARFLRIGGVGIRVASESPDLRFRTAGPSERFLVEGGGCDIRLQVGWRYLPEEPAGRLLFDSCATWTLHEVEEGYVFRFFSASLGRQQPYRMALLDRTFSNGGIYFHRPFFAGEEALDPLEFPLDELLVIHRLAADGGLEVHACGVVDGNGLGYLFAGQSGDGKTTSARIWERQEGATVLSDDRIVLREKDGEILLYGTPWHGDAALAVSRHAPLAAVFFLERGHRNEAIPVSRAEVAAFLLARSFVPFHSQTGLEGALRFSAALAEKVPCYRLAFVPDAGVLDFVRRTVGAARS